MAGRHVFMGYLNDPGQTATAIDEEFYLHTGDVGQLDMFGFLHITGRLKVIRPLFTKSIGIHETLHRTGAAHHGRRGERCSSFDRGQHQGGIAHRESRHGRRRSSQVSLCFAHAQGIRLVWPLH